MGMMEEKDLGVRSDICLTDPDTCLDGGTMALWINMQGGFVPSIIRSKQTNIKTTGFLLTLT